MIDSKELRIGNLVLDPYGNEREVTGVTNGYVWLKRDNDGDACYPASELSPIPVNPELFSEPEVFLCDMTKGLHWLQNEYYFRTGSELEIAGKGI